MGFDGNSAPIIFKEEKRGLLEDRSTSDSENESIVNEVESQTRITAKISSLSWDTSAVSASWHRLCSVPWRVIFIRLLIFLAPSFLQGRRARDQICPPKVSPTAYLDGMRGLAALFVFFCHYFYQAFTIAKSWGTGEDNYHILKLPFLRLWYQGPPAVCVFFIISGYALSYRPLLLMRRGAFSDFSANMTSLTYRRGIRLYLPSAISTLMIVFLLRIGAYEWTREFAQDRTYMKNIIEPHPARMESLYAQLRDWLLHMYRFVHVFDWDKFGGSTSYDVHLWTIPVEFRCSLYLFLTIIGTARLRTILRFLTVGGIMWFTYRHSRWELCLFFCGMLLAEMDHIRGVHASAAVLPQSEESPSRTCNWLEGLCWTATSVLGLYLMSQPDDGGEIAPGWSYLSSLIPAWWAEEKYRYWQSCGAVLFVLAVGHSGTWQRFFNLPVVQYLGKISYSLYLVHGPAMHTVGYLWERMAYGVSGVQGYWYNAGFALGAVFCVPSVIWWADVFWRAVDMPSVKLAKWVEGKSNAKH
ncbi:hypothetical protein UVI_02041720 [Ustilaginoidea virens]|nr:hypothetical protein UVI_02041720 [Ustilaginoidea virens]